MPESYSQGLPQTWSLEFLPLKPLAVTNAGCIALWTSAIYNDSFVTHPVNFELNHFGVNENYQKRKQENLVISSLHIVSRLTTDCQRTTNLWNKIPAHPTIILITIGHCHSIIFIWELFWYTKFTKNATSYIITAGHFSFPFKLPNVFKAKRLLEVINILSQKIHKKKLFFFLKYFIMKYFLDWDLLSRLVGAACIPQVPLQIRLH